MRLYNLITICLLISILSCTKNSEIQEHKQSEIEKNHIDTTTLSLAYLEPLHKRKTLKNYDKSLSYYINAIPNKPDSVRKVIYIIPLGNINPTTLEIIKNEVSYLNVFFQLEIRILEHAPFNEIKNKKVKTRLVPSTDYEYYSKLKGISVNLTEQIEANSLIDNYLKGSKPADAVAVLGITEHDLYLPKMNFIYGVSSLSNGIGIISTYRIAEYPFESKINIRKAATKQIANLFSIPNVKDYQCVLNYHLSIDELRNGVLYISPVALEKLKYSIGFDYNKRFEELKEYYLKEKNKEMANYYTNCIKLSPTSLK